MQGRNYVLAESVDIGNRTRRGATPHGPTPSKAASLTSSETPRLTGTHWREEAPWRLEGQLA